MSLPSIHIGKSNKFLSRGQVAEIFSVSPSTITRWADEGKLPYIRTLGGHRRYIERSILHLVDTRPREDWMEKITVDIPSMYGDHHAAAVHQSVAALPGVQEVWASAAFRRLNVKFNPEVISPEAILAQLERSGFHVANGKLEEVFGAAPETTLSRSNLRMTQTHVADR